jgi:preprotein translocase subunit SecE
VARNRKRARQSRPARRPDDRSGLATARGQRAEATPDPLPRDAPEPLPRDAPDPIAHATPDSELADAQLALGRPELVEESPEDEAEFEREAEAAASAGAAALAVPAAQAPARAHPGNRLINFLRGSWHELQRVQWPDRQQVMQATGVVIGFVIVAGVFLGLSDLVASKIVNLIIK